MALRVFHPCQFFFADQDIRVDVSTTSGGVSLSGYEDVIGTSGGGIWRADFTNADFGDRNDEGRAETLSWRAVNAAMQGGSISVDVLFCDPLHQPVSGDGEAVPHSDRTPFADETLYRSSSASGTVLAVVNGQAGGNRATILDIALTSGRPLLGGERFSYQGAGGWGVRAAEIYSVETISGGYRIEISPPIRGGIKAGDMLDFDKILCRMRRTSPASNPLNMGAFSSASISFQEDMRPPVQP